MAEAGPQPSHEERDFWESQFRDPRRASPRDRAPRPSVPRRELRMARGADSVLIRVGDRLRDWRADARFGVIVLVLVAVVAGFIWYRVGMGGAGAGESSAAVAPVTTTAAHTATTEGAPVDDASADGRIAVHVAGAVARPGVVDLRAGARVIDAVEAVGGAQPEGDLDRLNLAAKVSDGQRIFVAKAGEADPAAAMGDATGAADSGSPATGAPDGKVNLNTATQAQLEELPGIGPTYAQAIIAERQRRGGFTSVNDLRSVRGIGDKRFADLAPLVTV
jgi:competence protein ComEA